MNSRTTLALALAAGLAAAGCSPVFRNHGYVPADDQMSELRIGRDTQAEVAAAIGRPTALGIVGEDGWYYVQSRFRFYGYREPVEIDREVVAVSFTEAGTLRNIERFGLEQGRVVTLSRRVTESNRQGTSFLRQLFRNVGNVDASQFLDDAPRR